MKPMNCPGPLPPVREPQALLPRAAAAARRVLAAAPQRAQRHADRLSRVRAFAQDDAHVFCEAGAGRRRDRPLLRADARGLYGARALTGVEMAVSTRPEKFERRARRLGARRAPPGRRGRAGGLRLRDQAGRGGLLRPQDRVRLRDVLGRPWTLATLQIDVAMPGRFGLRYIGRDGAPHQPAMLHRAVLGSLERFIALYVEQHGRRLPALARAGAGAGAPDRRAAPRIRPQRARNARRTPVCAPSSTNATIRSASRSVKPSCTRSP